MNMKLFPNEQELCAARILIIDDEQVDIGVLDWTLRAAKFANIRSTTDSKKALEIFQQFQPDLVLLDLHMPKPDGFDILREFGAVIRADDFLPVLVLTGNDTAETRKQTLAAGASDFLGKPIDCSEVILRIKNLLQTRFLHQQAREMQKQLDATRALPKSELKSQPI
jgi:putative two-component system response regulator